MKKITLLTFILTLSLAVHAQTHNAYSDSKQLLSMVKNNQLPAGDQDWFNIVKAYLPNSYQGSYNLAYAELKNNPFLKSLLQAPSVQDSTNRQSIAYQDVSLNLNGLFSSPGGTAANGQSTAAIADVVTQLILERAKEELTTTFFQQMKGILQKNPELSAAFPLTTKAIIQIEPYLYASYINTLRQSFFADINNLPFNLGTILKTPRIKVFLKKYPKTQDVWYAVPIIQCLADLHAGKPIADAIKELYPDDELSVINEPYYNTLKTFVTLSESIRSSNSSSNWISEVDIKTLFEDKKSSLQRSIFLGLLFEETKEIFPDIADQSFDAKLETKIGKIENLLVQLSKDYDEINTSKNILFIDYEKVKKANDIGTKPALADVLNLMTDMQQVLKNTFDEVDALFSPTDDKKINADLYFADFSVLMGSIRDFDGKNYTAGVANVMTLINQFVANRNEIASPFASNSAFITIVSGSESGDAATQINQAVAVLNNYAQQNSNDKTVTNLSLSIISAYQAYIKDPKRLDALNKTLQTVASYAPKIDTKGFYASDVMQQLLKYATLMASLAEAKTTADAQAALDAAILPVGSSSIKYYTSYSFSLNSYIGAAYFHSNYQMIGENGKETFNTLGVALPIGPNFSFTTRGSFVGAISVFVPVIDLGAVASYRLNNPPTSTTQTLPAFTLQNILSPGAFLVFNRILKTPLAFGFGWQRAPELSAIQNGTAVVVPNPKDRLGAFLSVDIPLFNLYSHALKRPITN